MIVGIDDKISPGDIRLTRGVLKRKIYDEWLYKLPMFSYVLNVSRKKYGKVIGFVKTIKYFYKKFPFIRLRFLPKQWYFFKSIFIDKREINILKGGNKSGKTYAVLASALYYAFFKPNAKIWIVMVDFNLGYDVIVERMKNVIGSEFKLLKEELIYYFVNKSRIVFKSSASDLDAFQSASVDFVVFDERPPEEVFKECYARTIDTKGQVAISYTPVGFSNGTNIDWIYDKFIGENRSWDDDEFIVIETSTLENRFNVSTKKVEKIKSMSEEEYLVRVYGAYVNSSGIFDLTNADKLVVNPKNIYGVAMVDDNVVFTSERLGTTIEVYSEYPNLLSFVGVDIASGIGKDYSVALGYTYNGKLIFCLYSNQCELSVFVKKLLFVLSKYAPNSILFFERNGVGLAFYELIKDKNVGIFKSGRLEGISATREFKRQSVALLKALISKGQIELNSWIYDELKYFSSDGSKIFSRKRDDFTSALFLIVKNINDLVNVDVSFDFDYSKNKNVNIDLRRYSLL